MAAPIFKNQAWKDRLGSSQASGDGASVKRKKNHNRLHLLGVSKQDLYVFFSKTHIFIHVFTCLSNKKSKMIGFGGSIIHRHIYIYIVIYI